MLPAWERANEEARTRREAEEAAKEQERRERRLREAKDRWIRAEAEIVVHLEAEGVDGATARRIARDRIEAQQADLAAVDPVTREAQALRRVVGYGHVEHRPRPERPAAPPEPATTPTRTLGDVMGSADAADAALREAVADLARRTGMGYRLPKPPSGES